MNSLLWSKLTIRALCLAVTGLLTPLALVTAGNVRAEETAGTADNNEARFGSSSTQDRSHGEVIHLFWKKEEIYDHNKQTVTLTGGARAIRGTVTVDADTLIGYLRKKAPLNPATQKLGGTSSAPGPQADSATGNSSNDTGGMELYRVEARGHVRVYNQGNRAEGDHGLYDVDKGVILLTGKAMKVTTQNEIVTARDLMEYYPKTHISIGRGDATVTTKDGKRITGDILEAVGLNGSQKQANERQAAGQNNTGHKQNQLDRAYGWGHVMIRTQNQTARGERGVYLFGPQLARLVGHVRITQGQNQNNGSQALVNMKTGIATMLPDGKTPVQGLIIPNEAAK